MNEQNQPPSIFQAILSTVLFYIGQSFVVAVIVAIIWGLFLRNLFGLNITFLQWFGGILCFNLIRFDLMKFITAPQPPQIIFKKEEEQNEIQ